MSRIRIGVVVTFIAVGASMLGAVPASAQEGFGYGAPVAREGDASTRRNRNRVWVDLPFWVGSVPGADVLAFAPYVGAMFRPADVIEIELGWGFPFASVSETAPGGQTYGRFAAGNPYVGVNYINSTPSRDIRIGGGLAFPVATLPDVDLTNPDSVRGFNASVAAYNAALGMWGFWNSWLYVTDAFSIVIPVSIDARPSAAFRAGGSAAAALEIPVRDSGARDTELVMQFDGYVGYQASSSFGMGLRLALVVIPTAEEGDNAQFSFEPFFKFDIDQGFIRLGFLMNLDDPYGFSFDDGGIWAIRTTIGARF